MNNSHKILIVDDEPLARKYIANLVSRYIPNVMIRKISNSKKALYCIQNEDFDMMFLDIKMPGMSGLELLERVKCLGKDPYTIIVTAYCDFDYAVKGIDLGVVKYIVKPLEENKILEAISMYLKKIKATTLTLKVPNGVRNVKIDNILAIETISRGMVKVFTSTGLLPLVTGTLNKMYQLLPPNFNYIRRNCVVNLSSITGYNIKEKELIIMCNNKEEVFSVSRGRWKELRMTPQPK